MLEIKSKKYYCSECNDLCTIIVNESSKRPKFCPKTQSIVKWMTIEEKTKPNQKYCFYIKEVKNNE